MKNEQASLHVHAYLHFMGWLVYGDKQWRLYYTQRTLAPVLHKNNIALVLHLPSAAFNIEADNFGGLFLGYLSSALYHLEAGIN